VQHETVTSYYAQYVPNHTNCVANQAKLACD